MWISEQQPLRLNPAEVCEVIASVCSEASSPNTNVMTVSSTLNNNYGKPSMDAAVSVLIKLVIDMNDFLCNKCKRPGHFARDCPNMTVCNNCGLPGHIAAECNSTTTCWNCKEPGHLASQCPNDPVCHAYVLMCGKMGHLARGDCSNPSLPSHDARLCNNCYKPGHIAVACTNEKACNNCRKSGHLARDYPNDPVCNICNLSGHVARHCAKSGLGSDMGGGPFREIICRNCGQPGHVSRECVSIVICSNCGRRGHQAYECPSAFMHDRGVRRY